MPVRVLDDLCSTNGREAVIVVEAETIEGVQSTESRTLALQKAGALGLTRPGLDRPSGPYPVDAEGKSDEEVVMGRRPLAAYRQDYKILAGL